MAIKRYQSREQFKPGPNPYHQVGQGIQVPSAPQLTPPPPAPNLARPRTSPAHAKATAGANVYKTLASTLDSWSNQMAGIWQKQRAAEGYEAGIRDGLAYEYEKNAAEKNIPKVDEPKSDIVDTAEKSGVHIQAPILPPEVGAFSTKYKEGALLAHEAATKNDIARFLEVAYTQHNSDPIGFAQKVEAFASELASDVAPDIAHWIPLWVEKAALPYQAKTEYAAYINDIQHQRSIDLRRAKNLTDDAINAAFLEGDLSETVFDKINELEDLYYGMVKNDLLNEDKIPDLMAPVYDSVIQEIVLGNFKKERFKGIDEAKAYREKIWNMEFRERYTEDPDDSDVQSEQLAGVFRENQIDRDIQKRVLATMDVAISKMETAENRQDAIAAAEQRQIDAEAKKKLDNFKAISKNFDDMDQTTLKSLTQDMVGTKHEAEFFTELKLWQGGQQFQALPWDLREDAITALQSIDSRTEMLESDDQQVYEQERPLTLEEQAFQSELYDRLVSYHQKQKSRIDNGQGLQVAVEENLIQDVEGYKPNMSDQERVGWLQIRDQQADLAEQFYGRSVNRLTDGEITQITRDFDTVKSSDEILSFMSMMVEGLGSDVYPVLNKFLDDDVHMAYAAAGNLLLEERLNGHKGSADVASPSDVAYEILNGMKYRNEEFISKENESYVRRYVQAMLGDAYRGDVDNTQRRSVEDAVLSIMAYRVLGENPSEVRMTMLKGGTQIKDNDDNYNKMIMTAVNDAMGGVMEFEWTEQHRINPKYQLPVPQRGMKDGDFERYLKSLTVADIRRMGGLLANEWTDVKDALPGSGDGSMRLVYAGVVDGRHGYFISQANGLYVARAKWTHEMGPPPTTLPQELQAQPASPFILYFDPNKEMTPEVSAADAREFYEGSPQERREAVGEAVGRGVEKIGNWLKSIVR